MGSNQRRKRRAIRHVIDIVIFLAVVIGGYYAYENYREGRGRVTVTFQAPGGTGSSPSFELEVARTDAERRKGLMFRKASDLPEHGGMVFIFPEEAAQSFWMKDTPLSLDILFLDNTRKVVGIVKQAQPFSLESRSVAHPSRFVVELHGGMADRYQIREGDLATFSRDILDAE